MPTKKLAGIAIPITISTLLRHALMYGPKKLKMWFYHNISGIQIESQDHEIGLKVDKVV